MSPPIRRSRPAGNGPAGSSSGHHRDTPKCTAPPRHDPAGAHEPTLDDALEEARRARDEGAANAENSLYTPWRLWAEHELDKLIASGELICADDLRAIVGDPPDGQHRNGIGGIWLRAVKAGRLQLVGYRPSTRPAARGRPVRVWRGAA